MCRLADLAVGEPGQPVWLEAESKHSGGHWERNFGRNLEWTIVLKNKNEKKLALSNGKHVNCSIQEYI